MAGNFGMLASAIARRRGTGLVTPIGAALTAEPRQPAGQPGYTSSLVHQLAGGGSTAGPSAGGHGTSDAPAPPASSFSGLQSVLAGGGSTAGFSAGGHGTVDPNGGIGAIPGLHGMSPTTTTQYPIHQLPPGTALPGTPTPITPGQAPVPGPVSGYTQSGGALGKGFTYANNAPTPGYSGLPAGAAPSTWGSTVQVMPQYDPQGNPTNMLNTAWTGQEMVGGAPNPNVNYGYGFGVWGPAQTGGAYVAAPGATLPTGAQGIQLQGNQGATQIGGQYVAY